MTGSDIDFTLTGKDLNFKILTRIETELDVLAAEIQRLTRLYEQKLAALEDLKQSLLHQAFAGEL